MKRFKLSKFLLIFLVLVFSLVSLIIVVKAATVPYEPSGGVKALIWLFLYPILIGLFFYLVYVKKESPYYRNKLKSGFKRRKFMAKLIGPLFVLFFSTAVPFTIQSFLGLVTYHIATKKFSEKVKVSMAYCQRNFNTPSDFELNFIDKNHLQNTLHFPYKICRNSHLTHLGGKQIILIGRKCRFGKVYDGFYYLRTVDHTHS